jgi:tetratricopeptide (TPR) repeat protein
MKKTSSKYWYILTTVIISLGLFNSGCLQLEKFSLGGQSKTERINILEEEVESLSNNIGSLTTENYELKKNVVKLETAKNQLNNKYTQIKDKQIAIEAAQTSQNKIRKKLEEELAETKDLLGKVKQQLAIVENDKNNLKTKLEKLGAPREKAAEEEKGNVGENRENLAQETQETSPVEDLLDKAIQLYREENFEEAIAKWEEVIALDPSKLEAKFNIEIAQDRIKEKQIQEDLKSSRIQRK